MNEQDKITEIKGKGPHPEMPFEFMYANAYVPIQQYNGTMSPGKSLMCGTAFAELVMPYGGWKTRLSW